MMRKSHLLTFMLSTALASVPVCSFAAVPQDHQDHNDRNDRNDRKAAAHKNYHFRAQDRTKLQQHYRQGHPHPEHAQRHHWAWHRGVNLTGNWHTEIEPLPQEDIALLPPPPPGYMFGYYNGWAIIYDPNTGAILDAVEVE